MNMHQKAVSLLFLSAFAGAAMATEVLWTGGAEEETPKWATGANWEGGVKPGTGDTAIFRLTEPLRISDNYAIHELRVESGALTVAGTGTVYGGEDGTGTVYVAENASLYQSGQLFADKTGTVFAKTGGGSMLVNSRVDQATRFPEFGIQGGTFVVGGAGGATGFFSPTNIVIYAGGTLKPYTVADGADQSKAAAFLSTSHLEIKEGGTFDCVTQSINLPVLSGAGRIIRMCGTLRKTENFTGTLSVTGGTTFGNSTTPDDEPDLSKVSAIEILGASESSPAVKFYYANPCTIAALLTGRGRLYIYGPMTFANANLRYSQFDVYDSFGLSGGTVSAALAVKESGQKLVVSNGTRFCGGFGKPSYCATSVKRPSGVSLVGGSSPIAVQVQGGGEYYSYDSIIGPLEVLEGGRFYQGKSFKSGITALFDGGAYVLNSDWYGYQGLESASATLKVGPGGWRVIQNADEKTSSFTLTCSIVQADAEKGDGGADMAAVANFTLNTPFGLTGPIYLRGGSFSFANTTANAAAKDGLLGMGDLIGGNAFLAANATLTPLKFASGAGSKLRLNESLELGVPVSGVQEITFGDANAAAGAGLARAKGGILVVQQDGDGMIDGTTSRIKVNGGVPVDATTGLVRVPIFTESKSDVVAKKTGIWARRFYLTGYDAEKGLFAITDYTSGIAGGATSLARVTSATLAEDATAQVAALNIIGSGSSASTPTSSSTSLKLSAGSRLTVGNGTDPAYVLMNSDGDGTTAAIKGEGTLDFGTSEGVVLVNRRPNACLMTRIAGSGGVTFAGPGDKNGQSLHLNANEYSGGTWINSLRVYPHTGTAFGTGDVHVGGGDWSGGRIAIPADLVEKPVFANRLFIGGMGGNLGAGGAMTFNSSADWTGAVTLTAKTRFSVAADQVATFSGGISGDCLQLFCAASSTNELGQILTGEFVLSGSNTYTGGTEVVRSALVLKNGATAGTGSVLLDRGTLVLDNGRDAYTVVNRIYGVGTVALRGKGVVDVDGRIDTETQEGATLALDVQKNGARILSLDGFASVTNTTGKAVTLRVAATTPFEGPVDPRVTLAYGDVSNPGMMIIFR